LVDSRLLSVLAILNDYSIITCVTNVFLQGDLQGGLLSILRPSIDSISRCGFLISLDDLVRVIGDYGGLEKLG
jgi:hypothetical protein